MAGRLPSGRAGRLMGTPSRLEGSFQLILRSLRELNAECAVLGGLAVAALSVQTR